MIGEIAIALKALDSAYTICRDVVGKTKDVNDWAGAVNKFLYAKGEVDEHIAKAKEEGKEDLFEGSALQEAMSISQLEERQTAMMAKIGQAYSDNFKSHIWAKIKKDAVRIQKQRDAKTKRNAQRAVQEANSDALLLKQLGMVFLCMFGAVAVIAGIAFFIFGVEQ
ncbi:MAG: hypothetical protein CL532_01920 [Aestuariivita sp.]|nr:hypothetical protein [Aestuariivita sp.]